MEVRQEGMAAEGEIGGRFLLRAGDLLELAAGE